MGEEACVGHSSEKVEWFFFEVHWVFRLNCQFRIINLFFGLFRLWGGLNFFFYLFFRCHNFFDKHSFWANKIYVF